MNGEKQRLLIGAFALALACVAVGAGGFLIASGGGEDLDAARAEGAAEGRADGAADGSTAGFSEGFKRGRESGFDARYEAAYERAYRAAIDEAGLDQPRKVEVELP